MQANLFLIWRLRHQSNTISAVTRLPEFGLSHIPLVHQHRSFVAGLKATDPGGSYSGKRKGHCRRSPVRMSTIRHRHSLRRMPTAEAPSFCSPQAAPSASWQSTQEILTPFSRQRAIRGLSTRRSASRARMTSAARPRSTARMVEDVPTVRPRRLFTRWYNDRPSRTLHYDIPQHSTLATSRCQATLRGSSKRGQNSPAQGRRHPPALHFSLRHSLPSSATASRT